MFLTASDALVATIAFFDQFDVALSSAEVWMYCALYKGESCSLNEVEGMLENDSRLACRDGLWMLVGRQDLARVRVARGFPVHERWATASRAARLARLVPYLRLFAVCNTLGYGVAKEESDIDVFVVAERGRLWTTRFLLTGLLHVLRLRRHHAVIARRICLSFYVATDALAVAPLAIDGFDPYLAWWVGSVVPLVDRGVYADFVTANRPFVERYRKTFIPRQPPPIVIQDHPPVIPSRTEGSRHVTASFVTRVLESLLGGLLGDGIERILKKIQLRKMTRSSAGKHRENPTSVVISDHVLKFHENDRRTAIRDAWITRLEAFGIRVEI